VSDEDRRGAFEKQSRKSNMATRGGARPGAGRKKGQVSQAKKDLSAEAKKHAEAALQVLVSVAQSARTPAAARVAAATAILDRGYGKPRQSMEIDADLNLTPKPRVIEFVAPDVADDEDED
jgi:hypothetical protein